MVIFYKLNYIQLIIALLLSIFNIKLIYFKNNNLNNPIFNYLVKNSKLIHFSEYPIQFKQSSHKLYVDEPYKLIKKPTALILNNFISIFYEEFKLSKKEARALIFNKLTIDYNLFELIFLIKEIKLKKKIFLLIAFFNLKEIILLKYNNIKIYNYFYQIIYIFTQFIFIFNKKALKIFKLKSYLFNRKKKIIKNNIPKFFNVIFYPNQTTQYGDGIYSKDFFYLRSEKSKFNQKNILHIETQKNKELERFYKKKKLNYYFHSNNRVNNLFPIKLSINLFKYFLGWLFIVNLVSSKRKIIKDFDNNLFKDTKYCLIADDFNFDNLISIVLKEKKIKTISVQNRLIYCKWKLYSNILDTLYVMDNYSKKNFKNNKNNLVKNYKISGNILINNRKSKNKIHNRSSQQKNFVVCFDYSVSNYNEQMYDVSFKNQKSFFEDIYHLSTLYPKEKFIIKSKYIVNKNFLFSEILKKIKKAKNIELFNKNSKKYNQENLIYNSKVVITKPSSVIDECLFFNKKVIVHDYESNFKILIKDFINYGDINIFANSFKELNKKFKNSLIKIKNNDKIYTKNFYFYKKKTTCDIKSDIKYLEKKLLSKNG